MANNQPLTVGLTGGIGSGKTLISKIFVHIGVPVYYADTQAKKFYAREDIISQIRDNFGADVITDGTINTKILANIVFNNTDKLNILNKLIHPLVKEDFISWRSHQNYPYVIMESAIIYESGWNGLFDKIICVSTPQELIMKRVALRDNQSEEQIKQRISNQMPAEEKNLRSDFLVINDDIQLVIPQVRNIHNLLLETAKNIV